MRKILEKTIHIILDFDYTLADSSQGVYSSINYALENLGFPKVSYETACQTIGLSLWETYGILTSRPAGDAEEFIRLFVEQADSVMTDKTRLFEDTPGIIRWLKQRGYKLGIVSTKFRFRIEEILERDGLLSCFDVIIGGEDVQYHKPNPESLLLAMNRMGATEGNSVYIGDSWVDAKSAQSIAVPFIAVLTGTTPAEAFVTYRTVDVLSGVRDLTKLF